MRITIEQEGKLPTVYQSVTDCFLVVRQMVPKIDADVGDIVMCPEFNGEGIGPNVRDLSMNVHQRWMEMQKFIPGVLCQSRPVS